MIVPPQKAIVVLVLTFLHFVYTSHSYIPSVLTQLQFNRAGRCIHPACFIDQDSRETFELYNVQGDGDCVFRAIRFLTDNNNNMLVSRSRVAHCLEQNRTLHITTKNHTVGGHALLRKAASDLNVTVVNYLDWLRTPGAEGGLYAGTNYLCV